MYPRLARLSALSALLIRLSSFLALLSAFRNRLSSFSSSLSAGFSGLSRTWTGIAFDPDAPVEVEVPGIPGFEGPNPLQKGQSCNGLPEKKVEGKETRTERLPEPQPQLP